MVYELDQFGRDLVERLEWVVNELGRLSDENERLLRENKELREEVTLVRLQSELGHESNMSAELTTAESPEPVLSPEALQFYRGLPEKINFSDFFRLAEAAEYSGARARQFMLAFFRRGMLEQRGRRLQKSEPMTESTRRETQGA